MTEDLQQLAALRCRIDAIDEQLLALINQRAGLAQAVGKLKTGPIYRPEREAQVLRRIGELNPGPLERGVALRLFREIMSACLALEQPLTVAYLGPQGTFTQEAAVRKFGHAVLQSPCASIDDVFRKVETGNADYGVVPAENSTEGAVNRTLDLLQTTPLHICGEIELRIHQSLLRLPRSPSDTCPDLEGAKVVYSHSQSLAQCHEWLSTHLPGVVQVTVASNAEAARLASLDDAALAIAGEQAAEVYGLARLYDRIEDEPDNTTRFVVLARNDVAQASGDDKTSLLMAAPNQPGAMVRLLEPFRDEGVSLTKLESRPARLDLLAALDSATPWKYVFFVDIEGHRNDVSVKAALQRLAADTCFVKVLGSYPKSVA